MSASSPRPRSSTDLTSALVSAFECPVCLDPVMPPIAQCINGHLLCFPCRKKVSMCPLCREHISNVRALAMEKVAEKLPYPCNYSDYGCPAKPILKDKPDHEKTCEFRPCACVFTAEACKWTGPPRDMLAHIREAHKNLTTMLGEKTEFVINNPDTPWNKEIRAVQLCSGQHFMLVLAKQQVGAFNLVRVFIQILGTPKEAQQFTYKLEIRGDDRTLTWSCRPTSVLEGIQQVTLPGDGLVFDSRSFAHEAKLNVKVTIKRLFSTDENRGQGDSDCRDSYFRMFGAPGKKSSDVQDGARKQTARTGNGDWDSEDSEANDLRDSYFRMFKPRKQYP